MDVADELVRRGRVINQLGLADQHGLLLRVGLAELPTDRPYALSIPQQITEQILRDRAETLAIPVLAGHRVRALGPEPDMPVVHGVDADGREFSIRSRYLVGADGAHSVVRHQLGIDFRGNSYPMPLALADIELAGLELNGVAPPDDMSLIQLSPAGVSVLIRLPDGAHRVMFTFAAGSAPTAEPDKAWVGAELERRGLVARPLAEPVWTSSFTVHHRLADSFAAGRTFLAGDAAHLHSPASGQGMNTGIADGYDLGHRIGRVLTGESETLLDGYTAQRRRAAVEVIRFTDAMTRMATAANPILRATRRRIAGAVGGSALLSRRMAVAMSGLRRTPLHSDPPAAGARQLVAGG